MSFIENYRPALVPGLAGQNSLQRREVRPASSTRTRMKWVGSILPDEGGFYDAHAGSELVRMIRCRYSMGLVV